MDSITLIHPEETFTVPTLQTITKCSLFQNNPALLTAPYRVKSSVFLSIFREFVSELEGKTVNITETNLSELQLLCKEFGFDEFSTKLSKFFEFSNYSERRQLGNPFVGMRSISLKESIEFIVNGTKIELEIAEAAALFPAIREQLSVDGCGRKFYVKLRGIETSNIRSLELLLSGETISIGRSEGLLIGFLGNDKVERLLLNCWKTDNLTNLCELKKERCLDFKSIDVSIVSIVALDNLLLNERISIDSEDALLSDILKLGSSYRNLLRHIQLEFLSEAGLSPL
jgi:hypothetical protein